MLIVACRLMTSGDRGVSFATSRALRSCGDGKEAGQHSTVPIQKGMSARERERLERQMLSHLLPQLRLRLRHGCETASPRPSWPCEVEVCGGRLCKMSFTASKQLCVSY